MKINRYAFTMIELIFVIVILGILSAVAIPKFAQSKTQADIAKGRSDVATIRTAIMNERQKRLLRGDNTYIAGTALNGGGLFSGVLTYSEPDSTTDGHWHKVNETNATVTYNFKVNNTNVLFTYTRSTGKFTCDANKDGNESQKYCYKLTQ